MEFITLNNGVKMPLCGYGVFRMTDEKECEEAVYQALKAGYRYIDTASAYRNEEAVGRAIRRSGIKREDLFIVSKLWVTDTTYDKAKEAYQSSLDKLGLDYLDLYLIHQPYHDYYGAWRALEEFYLEGKVRAIGVDNFDEARLADFMTFQKVKPAFNFLEINPYYQRDADVTYMQSKDVCVAAWSPFAAGEDNVFKDELLLNIANKYHKSVAQVVLRWLYQRQIVSVCKSSNPKRMKENMDIFDFELSLEDMQLITTLDRKHSCFPARDTGLAVEQFLEVARKSK